MIGILKGDVIGSPYRELDTASEDFVLLNSFSAFAGSRLVTAEASLTSSGVLALCVGKWLGRGLHTESDLAGILEETFGSLRGTPGESTVGDPGRNKSYLAGAAVCGEWCDSMEQAQDMASLLLVALDGKASTDEDIALGDVAAARAMASVSWMAHHGASPSEMAAYMKDQTGVDITARTQESFRSALMGEVARKLPREEVDRHVDEVSDTRLYMALRKGLERGADSVTVKVPYVRRDASPLEMVRAAMYAALSVDGWEKGVRRAVSLGGDSSLIAALAGGLAEGLRPGGPDRSVDITPYFSQHVRESLAHYEALMEEKGLSQGVERLRDRFSGEVHERDITPVAVTFVAEREEAEAEGRSEESRPSADRPYRHDGVDFLFVSGCAEACVLGRDDQAEAVRAAYPLVKVLARDEFDALAARRQREHDRSEMGDMAMLSGPVAEVRRLYVEKDGALKGVTETSSSDVTTSPKARARAREQMDLLRSAAAVVMSQFISNGTGRDLLLPTAYRLESGYSESVRGYRGNMFRDDIVIDQRTGLLRRVESSDISVGEYQASDKMVARMFDGCDLKDRSGVNVLAAVENMKALVLDEGDRVARRDDLRDEDTGYRIDETEYYGAPQESHSTNLDRVDADFSRFSSDDALDAAIDSGLVRVVPAEERSLRGLAAVMVPKAVRGGAATVIPEKAPQPVPVPAPGDGFSVEYTVSAGGYRERTMENADPTKVDFTVAFAADFRTAGEKCTARACEWTDEKGERQSSLIRIQLPDGLEGLDLSREAVVAAADVIDASLPEDFLRSRDPLDMVINIAGNGLYTLNAHGITQRDLDTFVTAVFLEESRRGRVFSAFRSGGQTGADETVTSVAYALGCPATVHAPKGWQWRDSSGNDHRGEEKFRARFESKNLGRTYDEALSLLQERVLARKGRGR